MQHNVIIAGVGGQGILTIARVLSGAAMAKGLFVKQAEVHGMSQRGGAVYSHLRISSSEIFSDLIPTGQADMILAIEPLEALRYVPMLRVGGTIIASTNAEVNITDYPAIETVLEHVASHKNHVAIDMEKIARAAGGVLAANIVALGAASLSLGFTSGELEESIEKLFASKGERVVQTNVRAFRFGRCAAVAYREALDRGVAPAQVRSWIGSLGAEHLASADDLDFSGLGSQEDPSRLSGAEAHAFESLLMGAYSEGRSQLYEHEVYRLIELVGAISPPRYEFVPKGSTVSEDALANFPGEKVVLKLVSAEVVHKTEAGAVLILPKVLSDVRSGIERLVSNHSSSVDVAGVLVVEFVEHDARGLGSELFVGIRATREFGPVIAAGLGGVQTEYLASKMRPGVAVAKAVALDTDAVEFLELFKQTVAYDVLAGRTRGHVRTVSDAELLRCFRAFISIARQFCIDRGEEGPDIGELEVNPFAFSRERLVPLDGRGCLRPASKALLPRPADRVASLLNPKSIALIGVSAKKESFGRIILSNIQSCGFEMSRMWIVKAGEAEIDGVPCVASISELPQAVDLLVVTAPASATPAIVDEANTSGKVRSGIIISGGAGETSGSEQIGADLVASIERGRASEGGGAVFLGPNCMGLRSRPGLYDTFFIPEAKLPPRRSQEAQKVAIVSQSGAFIVSRLSSMVDLQPLYAVSIGNQCDVSVSDLLKEIDRLDEVRVVGVYLEGFTNLDGLETLRAVAEWTRKGKTVIFYKAGRTESGRAAAAGHTAAVAGDYDICQTALRGAGAILAEDFREFGQMLELSTLFADKKRDQGRVFAITNAGMEAVGMADAGVRFQAIGDELAGKIQGILATFGLQSLVATRNPLDVTPAADERVYEAVVREAMRSEEIDALIVSCVPLAPSLHTLPSELVHDHALPKIARGWRDESKPVIFVVDSGKEYDQLAQAVRHAGVPVFRSADEAARRLLTWLSIGSDR